MLTLSSYNCISEDISYVQGMSIWVHKKIFQCFTICKFKISQAKEHTKEKVMGLNYTYNITYGYTRTSSTMKHQCIGCK
jgi:hypothetical protein